MAHFNVYTTDYEPLPEFGGSQSILYRSKDRTRMAGSFKESGQHTLVMEYDEFMFVIAGNTELVIDGGEPLKLGAGDACYLRTGQQVHFSMSDDFHDVAVLISDSPLAY